MSQMLSSASALLCLLTAASCLAIGQLNVQAEAKHLGCFINSERDPELALTIEAPRELNATFYCLYFCRSKGYKYFGVTPSQPATCRCGNSYGQYGRTGSSRCPSWSSEIVNDVYTTGIYDWESGVTYLGCYQDGSDRDLQRLHHADALTTKYYCWNYCRSRGYMYFGLQATSHCTCGNSYGRHGRLNDSSCAHRCLGDLSAVCGGTMRNSLFTTGLNTTSDSNYKSYNLASGFVHLGCYADSLSLRDLPALEHQAPGQMTWSYCWRMCSSRGFKYFGLQGGDWCFCGNSFGRYGRVSMTECNQACSGNSSTTCGADLRNDVFATGIENYSAARHLGCFNNSASNSELALKIEPLSGDTITYCLHFCRSKGYKYFGVEGNNSRQQMVTCRCGNSYGRYGRADSSRCPSWSSEMVNDVYTTGIDDWENGVIYLGCFADAGSDNRDLPEVHLAMKVTSRYHCWNYCRERGYKYFGLQCRVFCTCGDSYGRHGQVEEGECNTKCEGDSSEMCGSDHRNNLFTTGIEPWDTKVFRVGCFKEDIPPDLPLRFDAGSKARSQFCWHFCHSRGFKYFGLMSGRYCSCGTSYGRHGRVNDSECNGVKCAGQRDEWCGGESRNEVFATGIQEWESSIIRLGCFEDRSSQRDLRVIHRTGQLTSKYNCWRRCSSLNFKYFGLQNGDTCACGDYYGRYGRRNDSACNATCLGDPLSKCGDNMLNEVFTTGLDQWEIRAQRLGCYADDATNRDLPLNQTFSTNSKHTCWLFCRSRGHAYMGLQAGQYCFCGDEYGLHGQTEDGECNDVCSGDETQTCGASLRNEIFSTGVETWEQGLSSLGCYNDSLSQLDLPLKFDAGNSMTKKYCWERCRARGYRYFGLQDSRLCLCGNSYGRYGKVEDSDCHERCRGDFSMTCGAELRSEIYETGVGKWESRVTRLGCFIDPSESTEMPLLAHEMGRSATKYSCWVFCRLRGYKYFSLQGRSMCFCDNIYGKHGIVSDSECSQKCLGDETSTCGGNLRSQVFTTGFKELDNATITSLGCYKDNSSDRDLPVVHHAGIQATRHYCRAYCRSRGYRYYGMQAGQWCVCGNAYGRYGRTGDSECLSPCPGDSRDTCGGYLRTRVFATGIN